MRILSNWARHHIWLARFVIVCSYLLLNICGVVVSDILLAEGIVIPGSVLLFLVPLVATIIFIYPGRAKGNKARNNYAVHKTCDFVLILSGFIMLVMFSGNMDSRSTEIASYSSNINASTVSNVPPLVKKKKSGRELRKKLRAILKELKTALKKGPEADRILLLLLVILVTLALCFIIASLACSIACSGSEVLAYIVLFGGWIVVLYFSARLVKRINKKYPKKRKPDTDSNT